MHTPHLQKSARHASAHAQIHPTHINTQMSYTRQTRTWRTQDATRQPSVKHQGETPANSRAKFNLAAASRHTDPHSLRVNVCGAIQRHYADCTHRVQHRGEVSGCDDRAGDVGEGQLVVASRVVCVSECVCVCVCVYI